MEVGEQDIFDLFRNGIVTAVRSLLETKYVYQSIDVSLTDVENLVKRANDQYLVRASSPGHTGYRKDFKRELEEQISSWKNSFWDFRLEDQSLPQYLPDITKPESIRIPLPSVKIPCSNCDAVLPPHNAGYRGVSFLQPDSFPIGRTVTQVFHLPYECQSCRREPVIFLVRRQDLKLTLCGRSQFQSVSIPKFIPEEIHQYYRNAIIAHRTGFTLAGILYLRVLIEQYMRSVTKAEGRYDLSELGESYGKTLPEDFRSRFPSLKKACDHLSASIHAADENVDLFTKTLADVERHFDSLRLFELSKRNESHI